MVLGDLLMTNILTFFPAYISNLIKNKIDSAAEISVRAGKPVCADKNICGEYIATADDVRFIINSITKSSVYAYMDEITNGFITVRGGHRIGICGTVVTDKDKVINIKDISSVNFRIARSVSGCADGIIRYIAKGGTVHNTLIISPVRCGKTTVLRELIRSLSTKNKICVIDERGEIAGVYQGVPQMDIGIMSDVMSLCPKQVAIPMTLRSMAPDIIAADELSYTDVEIIRKILISGSKLIATAHGEDIDSTIERLNLGPVKNEFGCIVLLEGRGRVKEIRTNDC